MWPTTVLLQWEAKKSGNRVHILDPRSVTVSSINHWQKATNIYFPLLTKNRIALEKCKQYWMNTLKSQSLTGSMATHTHCTAQRDRWAESRARALSTLSFRFYFKAERPVWEDEASFLLFFVNSSTSAMALCLNILLPERLLRIIRP